MPPKRRPLPAKPPSEESPTAFQRPGKWTQNLLADLGELRRHHGYRGWGVMALLAGLPLANAIALIWATWIGPRILDNRVASLERQMSAHVVAPGVTRILSTNITAVARERFVGISPMEVHTFYGDGEDSPALAGQVREFFIDLGWTNAPQPQPLGGANNRGIVITGYDHLPSKLRQALDTITLNFLPIEDADIINVNRAAQPLPNNLTIIVGRK